MQLHSTFGLLALFCISLKRLERIFLKSLHTIFRMYVIQCLKLSLRLIHFNTLKFQDKTILRTGQISALQHSLFSHIIFIMNIIRSETFIEIDSLQHLKILRQTCPTNLSKLCVITFTVLTLC